MEEEKEGILSKHSNLSTVICGNAFPLFAALYTAAMRFPHKCGFSLHIADKKNCLDYVRNQTELNNENE